MRIQEGKLWMPMDWLCCNTDSFCKVVVDQYHTNLCHTFQENRLFIQHFHHILYTNPIELNSWLHLVMHIIKPECLRHAAYSSQNQWHQIKNHIDNQPRTESYSECKKMSPRSVWSCALRILKCIQCAARPAVFFTRARAIRSSV